MGHSISEVLDVPLADIVGDCLRGYDVLWYYTSGSKSGHAEAIVANERSRHLMFINWAWSYGITSFGKATTLQQFADSIYGRSLAFYSSGEYVTWRRSFLRNEMKRTVSDMRKVHAMDYSVNRFFPYLTIVDCLENHRIKELDENYTTICGSFSWTPPEDPVEFFNTLPTLWVQEDKYKPCKECYKY